ncbi:lipopolysaccharide transport system permease protein/teichoic acid transport system permease protein [Varunaivibrio sulfuroxidans]|uniref:Lipopolysaccharide transport system permease protein/teichoic acid transport system permease protein n=2 Tax=Varunaivibrio sulfuroxidans TaxID=1773489 RepID=A0A4R3J5U0_9PROT|nr:lipopolysaccharide transport system permease protein/teichoic acid transport system permease protein [Varunaivibrio sulfuroxidans]
MIAHPVAIVTVFYFVFAVGFKAKGGGSAPYILWFVSGLVPWIFFNSSLISITNSVSRNMHLVKKTIFPTEIFPIVYLSSELFTHAVFFVILCGMLVFFNITFTPGRLLFLYFLFSTSFLLLGLGWLLSALQVFYKDISEALTILLNLLFWGTPIVWSPSILPKEYLGIVEYNPMYYIVEGYRGTLVYDHVVLPGITQTISFWTIAVLVFLVGNYVFRRLQPEFADI